jgi:hypothetical protein
MFILWLLANIFLVFGLGGFVILYFKWDEWHDDRYLDGKIGGWFAKQNYIFVQLFPPSSNERSMAEMEQFYINLSSVFSNKSEKDVYLEGKWYENFVFEIHSRGGQLGFYVKLNKNFLPLLRSSLAAHYPGATVVETPDPLTGFPKEWKGGAGPYNGLFVTDIELGKGDLYPLKSWKMFQTGSSTPLSDPMITLLSGLENIEPEDYVILQYVIQPNVIDANRLKEMKAELAKIRKEFATNASFEVGPDNSIQVLTKQERAILDNIEVKINNVNFKCKIRMGSFSSKPAPIRNLGVVMSFLKQFQTEVQFTKPAGDTKTTASSSSKVWGPFEDKYYWEAENAWRLQKGYKALIGRSLGGGIKPYYLDIETLTALFHFPATEQVDQSLASRITTDYGNISALPGGSTPPSNLPF